MSTSSTSPESIVIQCTAHDNHSPVLVTKNADNKTIKVYDLRYTVSFDTGTGGSTVASQTVAPAGTATEPADPTRTDYTFAGWYTSTDGGTTLSATPYDFTSAVYADLTLYAKWIGAVYMKTGSNIKTALQALGAKTTPNKTFSASATPPASGTTVQELSTADSPTVVKAWLDGTTIKYYADGYTNTGTKIPLNADSSEMFSGCSKLSSIDMSGFDTSNVTTMKKMFYNCMALTGITGLDEFDTGNVTDMYCMFCFCENLISLDVSNFDTSKVTNMGLMFANCYVLPSLNVSNLDTSSVTDMREMFSCCKVFTGLDVSGFNTSKVTDMSGMFNNCNALTNITGLNGFDTREVTTMSGMFKYCYVLGSLDLSSFNTGKVTDMQGMFLGCYSLTTLDLRSFNTSMVSAMTSMFNMPTIADYSSGSSLTTIRVSSTFVTTSVIYGDGLFSGCTLLVGGNGTTYDSGKTDKTYARIDTSSTPGYFTGP